ncbi:MAG: GH92 family glycosyl hydrolase [Bacteroidetes bacterium]|nr:GH92 family glycosyl hydrolase [Bacteroidota bacterium]
MIRSLILIFSFAGLCNAAALAQLDTTDYTRYADPLNGTKGLIFYYGRTTPFVGPPFAMTKWSACTQPGRIGRPIYQYLNTHITGFRATHKPAMWMGDYGHVTLLPVLGEMTSGKLEQKLGYSHRHEIATPQYYSLQVSQQSHKMKVEMTATSRCGIVRFSYPSGERGSVVLEKLHGHIEIDTALREIRGWNTERESEALGPPLPHFKGYFIIRFDQPFAAWGTADSSKLMPYGVSISSASCGAWVSFAAQQAEARVATSFISLEQARENLDKEITGKDFDQIVSETKAEWNTYLSRIKIEGGNRHARDIVYAGMYHALLFPREFSEYGHYYSAFDDAVHAGVSYNDYSLWDTYRAEHPLLLFIAPEHVPGMVQSLVQMYQEGGWMPKWPNPTYSNIMIGTHADAVIADAMVKGVKGFNEHAAYQACLKDAMTPPDGDAHKYWGDRVPWTSYEARQGLTYYATRGYVPVDKTAESVSCTMEYAYDDFCVAQVARLTGHFDTSRLLLQRMYNYKHLYNRETEFFAPKKYDGTWSEDVKAGFTEGSPWTYLFSASHDIPGMIDLMGGREHFIERLDDMFRGWHYVHENEPGHNYTYLYDYAGAAWKTQQRVAHYRHAKYRDQPNGMNGDDDCGQMSAWYIFSSLGFYPVVPGTDEYAIGTPAFPKMTLFFDPQDHNKKFEVIAHNVSGRNKYVQSVTINGRKLESPFIHHSDIVSGGQLIFEMGARPQKKMWK